MTYLDSSGVRFLMSFMAHVHPRADADHDPLLGADRAAAGWLVARSKLGSGRHAWPDEPNAVVSVTELSLLELRGGLRDAAANDLDSPRTRALLAPGYSMKNSIRHRY